MSFETAVILGLSGPRITPAERALFAAKQPVGFILFNRNLEDADQIRALCADIHDSVGWNAPIFIDQEGGRVQRLRPPLVTEWLPPLDDVKRFGKRAAAAMELRYEIIARELLDLGIDGNCVPCLDIARPNTHAVLRNRCYGEDVETIVEIGKAVIKGCVKGGALPVMKHMPGHGLATLDSHLDLPRVSVPRSTLDDTDFAVFKAFSDAPFGMSAHLVFEDIDMQPSTTSPVMIDLIRSDIGFGGLLMTDDISMEALSGTVTQRSRAALDAGCDVVLHCNGDIEEMQAVCDVAGALTPKARARAQSGLATRHVPENLDIETLKSEFDALI